MTSRGDFEDRLAARLLGVDVDADPAQVRSQFRRLARAVHPDTSVAVGCVDLGRLAEAKRRLIARAESRDHGHRAEQERSRRADAVARERLLRVRREQEARRRVERLRLVQDPAEVIVEQAQRQGASVPRRRSASAGRVGLLVDLAG